MSLSPITCISGTAVPIPVPDMDTDRIIPARFLKCITFDELAGTMFWDERYDDQGRSKGFPVDNPKYAGASIILGGVNFGCGSSREHAPQAIKRSGIDAIIAPSFAEIFFGNSTGIGLPCVCASEADMEVLDQAVEADSATVFTVDLESMNVSWPGGKIVITMPEGSREALIQGRWDAIAELLVDLDRIDKLHHSLPVPGSRL